TRDLGEGLRARAEEEQVVRALGLVVDLVGELAPAPRLVRLPRAAVGLDALADAGQDLALALVGQLGVEQQQDLVVVHVPNLPSHGLNRPRPVTPLRVTARRAWREVAAV